MKLTEKILIILALLGSLLKFFLITGGILIVLSYSAIACLYAYFGFALFNEIRLRKIFKKDSYKETSTWRIVGAILMGLSMSIMLVGLLFKTQKWPGADANLILGIFTGSIILILSLFKFLKKKTSFYKNVIIRIGCLTVLSLIILIIPTLELVKIRFRNHPKYIEVFKKFEKDQNNIELSNNLWLEYNRATLNEEEFNQFMKFEYEQLKQRDYK